MNERIKELAEQAITEKLSLEGFIEALKKEPNDFYGFRVSELQKFAELIVRECAGICEKDGRWWAEKGYLMEAGEAGSLATQIKEHFGVE